MDRDSANIRKISQKSKNNRAAAMLISHKARISVQYLKKISGK